MEVRHALFVFAPLALAACAGIFGIDEITYIPPDASDDGDDATSNTDDGPIIQDDGGELTPASIPGVVLWLDARNGVNGADSGMQPNGTPVTFWEDRSPADNSVFAPNETASQPTFVTSSINGLPAVDFSSSIDGGAPSVGRASASGVAFGRGDFCMVVVAKFYNESTGHNKSPGSFIAHGAVGPEAGAGFYFMGGNQVAVDTRGVQMNGGPILGIGVSSPAGAPYVYNDGAPHVLVGRRYGLTSSKTATLELRVDGYSFGKFASQTAYDVDTSEPLEISDLFDNLDGQIAQLILIGGAFDDASLGELENYLLTTYAIPKQN